MRPGEFNHWSMMLLVPVLGWLFYGAFFEIPSHHNLPLPPSDDG